MRCAARIPVALNAMKMALTDVDKIGTESSHGNNNAEHLDKDHLDDTEQVQSNNLFRIGSSNETWRQNSSCAEPVALNTMKMTITDVDRVGADIDQGNENAERRPESPEIVGINRPFTVALNMRVM